jgi:hypothetical protein
MPETGPFAYNKGQRVRLHIDPAASFVVACKYYDPDANERRYELTDGLLTHRVRRVSESDIMGEGAK